MKTLPVNNNLNNNSQVRWTLIVKTKTEIKTCSENSNNNLPLNPSKITFLIKTKEMLVHSSIKTSMIFIAPTTCRIAKSNLPWIYTNNKAKIYNNNILLWLHYKCSNNNKFSRCNNNNKCLQQQGILTKWPLKWWTPRPFHLELVVVWWTSPLSMVSDPSRK